MFPGEYRTQSNSLIGILNLVSLTVSRGFDALTVSTFFQFKYFASYDEWYQFFLLFLPLSFPSSFIIIAFNAVPVLILLRLKQLAKKLLFSFNFPLFLKNFQGIIGSVQLRPFSHSTSSTHPTILAQFEAENADSCSELLGLPFDPRSSKNHPSPASVSPVSIDSLAFSCIPCHDISFSASWNYFS